MLWIVNPSQLADYKAQVLFSLGTFNSWVTFSCYLPSTAATVTDRGLSQFYPLISIWSATVFPHKTMQWEATSNQIFIFPQQGCDCVAFRPSCFQSESVHTAQLFKTRRHVASALYSMNKHSRRIEGRQEFSQL